MRPCVRERIGIGFSLSQAAKAAWGTERFWSYLSWWHQEIHYTIPQEKLARELENLFCDKTQTIGLGTTTPSMGLEVVAKGWSSLLISVPDPTGTWKFEGLYIQTNKKPHLLRRWVMWAVMGARWEGKAENLPPEYQRLSRFLEEQE